MEHFGIHTDIHMGEQALTLLADFPMKKAALFCDDFLYSSGMTKKAETFLKDRTIAYDVFSDIHPDPDLHTVSCGIKKMLELEADTIIAMGGGSVIDTAKAVRYIIENQNPQLPHIKLIAIPTTSGTGSEMTSFSVITDKESQTKYPLVDDKMLPDAALLDTDLVLSVPASITADTGMDVLTHAIEAFVSSKHCDFSDAFAEKSARIIFENLERAVKCGEDRQAREHIHNASCMAGIAFNSASLGLCHAMAHALGARFHISHGRCNAMLLSYVIMANGAKEPQRYKELADILGIAKKEESTGVIQLVNRIRRLQRRVGIPEKIAQLCVDKKEYEAAIFDMAQAALQDNCMKTNPCPMTAQEIEAIYRKL